MFDAYYEYLVYNYIENIVCIFGEAQLAVQNWSKISETFNSFNKYNRSWYEILLGTNNSLVLSAGGLFYEEGHVISFYTAESYYSKAKQNLISVEQEFTRQHLATADEHNVFFLDLFPEAQSKNCSKATVQ